MKIKIPIRLKISEQSKNYYLKIPVRVRVRAYVCAYDCQDTTGHGTPPAHRTRLEHTTGKGRTPANKILLLLGNRHAKKQKKLKKVCKYGKSHYLCNRNQITNKFNHKITKQYENINIKNLQE